MTFAAPPTDRQARSDGPPGSAPSPPVLVLQNVHARDAAGPRGRARGAVTDLSLSLGPGIHAILGAPEDGTLALVDVVTGARPPLRGKVSVGGHDPATTPSIRARLGTLAALPQLPPASSVGASIRLALRARGEVGHRFDAVLDPLGLSALHARRVRSLSFAEARAVDLALALTTPAPLAIALHEPLSEVAMVNLHLIQRRLRELASARTCVLVTTSSPADALALADRVHVLHRGFLVREVSGEGRGLGPGGVVELTAWIAAPPAGADRSLAAGREAARVLAAALSRAPNVRGVSWEEAQPGAGLAARFASLVRVRGDTAEACADALIDAAAETGVAIEAITQGAPELTEVRAMTDALLRGRAASLRATPLPVAPVAAPRDAARVTSSLPAPPARSPVEDGGPLGRPKSIPAPRMEDDLGPRPASRPAGPPRGPILPAPPPMPNIPGAGAASEPEDGQGEGAAWPSPTVNEGER